MLYLEDYLEMIEHLPQELRDRFTEMRELDLSVQNNLDDLEKRVKILFNDCKRYPNEVPSPVEAEFQNIRSEYYKTLDEADEKVQLASQMYDLVDKYLRRLDTELHKFKCELEADNKGITELLEKRSLELDSPTPPSVVAAAAAAAAAAHQQKENRCDAGRYSRPRGGGGGAEKRRDSNPQATAAAAAANHHHHHNSSSSSSTSAAAAAYVVEKRSSTGGGGGAVAGGAGGGGGGVPAPIAAALVEHQHHAAAPAPRHSAAGAAAAHQQQQAPQSVAAYGLGHIGAGPAIAAAASQAIAATQQMQQGRRTASLKASYEAIEFGGIGRELAGAAQTAIQAIQQDHHNNKKKQKKWNTSNGGSASGTSASSNSVQPAANSSSSSSSTANSSAVQAILNSVAAAAAASNTSSEDPTVPIEAMGVGGAAQDVGDGEWSYDPNEPRYCLCNQVSYGDMVACDNEDCPSEWFHYPCVGITAPPKGKWYCPQCTASMRRRGGRKN